MKLVLHMGMPKTGTSAFQNWALSHTEVLASHGIHGPSEFNTRNGNGALIAKLMMRRPADLNPEERRKFIEIGKWRKQFGSDDVALISAEAFASAALSVDSLRLIRQACLRLEFQLSRAVIIFRNPLDMLNSAYSQVVKTTHTRPDFQEFIASKLNLRAYDYPFQLANLRQAGFPVSFAAFKGAAAEVPLAKELMSLLGLSDRLPGDFDFTTPRANESIGGLGIIGARHIWEVLKGEQLAERRQPVITLIVETFAGIDDSTFNGFTPAFAEEISQVLAPSIEGMRSELSEVDHLALSTARSLRHPLAPATVADLDAAQVALVNGGLQKIAATIAETKVLRRQISDEALVRLARLDG